MGEHPYREYEADPLWHAVDSALAELEKNRDVEVTTRRELVIGFLVKACLNAPEPPSAGRGGGGDGNRGA